MRFAWMIGLAGLMLGSAAWAQDDAATLKQRIAELEAQNAKLRQIVKEQAAQLRAMDATLRQTEAQTLETRKKLAEAKSRAVELEKQKQQAVAEHRSTFVSRDYDASANQTELSTYAMSVNMLKGPRAGHWVNLSATYPGKSANSGKVMLGLQTQYSGSVYRGSKTMTINADGQTINARVVDYDRTTRMVGSTKARSDRSDEWVQVELSLGQVEQIGNAQSVVCSLSYAEFELPNRAIKGFGAFADAMKASP